MELALPCFEIGCEVREKVVENDGAGLICNVLKARGMAAELMADELEDVRVMLSIRIHAPRSLFPGMTAVKVRMKACFNPQSSEVGRVYVVHDTWSHVGAEFGAAACARPFKLISFEAEPFLN